MEFVQIPVDALSRQALDDGKVVARPLTSRHLLRTVHNRLAPGSSSDA